MATVVITLFLFVQFYVCKMDAVCIKKPRTPLSSRREKRWSMNSQRLDEIVAQLMQPVSMKDQDRLFNQNITELLEDYMTETGLKALERGEDVRFNFPEMAILLQHTVDMYSQKVDRLHQSILDYCDKLLAAREEADGQAAEGAGLAGLAGLARRARRRGSSELEFAHIALSAAAAREPAAPRPPPTLPRMYVELEPRVITASDAQLLDYAGEPIGLLSDFQVTWRLHRGLLVDELEDGSSQARTLRPISLLELQEAIAAAAPPPPPPGDAPPPPAARTSTPERGDSPPRTPDPARPHHTSDLDATLMSPNLADIIRAPDLAAPIRTPDLAAMAHAPEAAEAEEGALGETCQTPAQPGATADLTTPKLTKKERKRKFESNDAAAISNGAALKMSVGEDLRQMLDEVQEFSIPPTWIKKIVKRRRTEILTNRRQIREETPIPHGDFSGWSAEEGARAVAAAAKHASRLFDSDDDDGFFEQSSVADSDASRAEEPRVADLAPAALQGLAPPEGAGGGEGAGWQQRVLARAVEGAAPDVRALARAVLRSLGAAGAAGAPWRALRRDVAAPTSHVLLATLFLANSRNVEVLAGPALSVAEFSLRLLSTDEGRYREAAAQEPFLR
ncbi:unnamed protein product [Spodoptera littoralis]|uniref:Condensin II complex subunit H2 N-terminal domain-containing protein n=1 Tax=Spodoptera littoralis TaxID=7109 RepID=A0A9P0HZE1_SPOLI|nr:unnamed protein product [Spodoptera littoralis]CAH1636680.1 unnamed protein product [Spodoptera littoralis]